MSQNTSFLPPSPYLSLSERTGPLPVTLTNDYMFKVVFQLYPDILHPLLCSLLDLKPDDICTVKITNTLVPGDTVESKDTILDIRLLLNDDRLINLEMQVRNEGDWAERSLYYLCRTFNNLETGADYLSVKPAHHIGILNFGPPHVQEQFYSHYYMANETTHEIFSHKFRLSVLNLTQTELATEHDRQSGLTKWAAAFKATTWEEFQMLAEEDILFQKVSDAIYLLSENREVAEQCRRRMEAEAVEKRRQEREAEREKKYAELDKAFAEKEKAFAEQANALAEQANALAEKDSALAEMGSALVKKDNALTEKDSIISEKDNTIAEQAAELALLRAQIEALSHKD
ncbi:MAG: Rpn family recombination-promoting nuclease/putative transposase [Clostridium sp.]|nr:Rpn family recombination-promoting nuclease/putative transposase [Clostridium sp.]